MRSIYNELYSNRIGSENEHHFSWITDNIAIGDHMSPYATFDIIINADYPYNHVNHHTICKKQYTYQHRPYTLYSVGLCDNMHDTIAPILHQLLPLVQEDYTTNKDARILFRCFLGKSRSVALAIAYLINICKMTYTDAFNLVKEKRPISKMNEAFQTELQQLYG